MSSALSSGYPHSMAGPSQSPSPAQMTAEGAATATVAVALRHRLGDWLRERGVAAAHISDILLGVNEALTNCVDHAYRGRDQPGPMTLRADHERSTGRLSLCVTDHGRWQSPPLRGKQDIRGRGIILMRALAAHCTVSGRPDGTTVCLNYRCG